MSKTYYDILGRTTETIAAFTDGTPTDDTNQTTDYTYDGIGDVLTMTAVMPSGTPSQTTAYIYGVGTSGGLYSNDLIAGIQYPDPSTGYASSDAANDVGYAYDNLGETTVMVDQNATTHAYSYDSLGRLTLDAVTLADGSAVNNSILALGYSYTALSLPYKQTSYSNTAGTTVVNQVEDVYNGLQQLTTQYQEHTGAVSTGSSLKVQYGYSSITTGSRLVTMTYPNGRILHFGYGSSGGLDDTINRIDFLADDDGSGGIGSHLVDYTYLGLDTILGQSQANGVDLTETLDDLGNIAEMNWVKSGTSTDDFQYGYDRDGNVLYKKNLVNSSFSELYHTNSASSGDDNTAYDPLDRLTGFTRGTLSSSAHNGSTLDTVSTPNSLHGSSQSWSLDAIGNQTAVTTDGTEVDNSANSQNELTDVGGNSLTSDNNGNMTTDEDGNTLTYDAWNRLVTDSAGTTSYAYDANGWRIKETHSSTTTDVYFTKQDQAIEERQGSTITNQYVWSIDYVNDLLLRDDNSTSGSLGISGSGLGRRLFVQHDARYNTTAVVDTSGNVIQRYIYSAYGVQTVLTALWVTSSAANSVYGFEGGRYDTETGLDHFGAPGRDYDADRGGWIQKDPDSFANGMDLYEALASNPVKLLDPSGMAPKSTPGVGGNLDTDYYHPKSDNNAQSTSAFFTADSFQLRIGERVTYTNSDVSDYVKGYVSCKLAPKISRTVLDIRIDIHSDTLFDTTTGNLTEQIKTDAKVGTGKYLGLDTFLRFSANLFSDKSFLDQTARNAQGFGAATVLIDIQRQDWFSASLGCELPGRYGTQTSKYQFEAQFNINLFEYQQMFNDINNLFKGNK